MKRTFLFVPLAAMICSMAACQNNGGNKSAKDSTAVSVTDTTKQTVMEDKPVTEVKDSVASKDTTSVNTNAGTEESKVKEVATKFLEAFFAKDFSAAGKYATKESEGFLKMMEEMAKSGGKQTKPIPAITGVKIDGNNAVVAVSTPPSIPMKKINGEWKVNMDKKAMGK
ncbi:MAG: hypothetical protein WBP45_07245 [Daejeonella sp.]